MNDFEVINERAQIRQGMVAAYLDMGMELFEALRIVSLWDGVIEVTKEKA